ncbi:BlaR1 peptidase M56 [Gelidibacter algens]|uniref:BlaR1 peptidase M56 n=1 Tax=Gelidibacter algens TaxID=49280 RepID=A0A1A7QZI4_9FLAO|nr:M56 family metallopeptidase [Gelidibacter algens]OBX24976.1 hypothetical protein A9996_12315 [Gelidibacter algens]RAJ19826.1 BlaR1 peptidase M56 [Gelidibacter algens]
MLIYLLKSGACLAIFMAFYKFFLERENMHVFKRYYLLGALIIAFVIPLVTFTHYIEVTTLPTVNEPTEALVYYTEDLPQPQETNYLPMLLWSIYGLGVLVFGAKFLINLLQIIFKINRNPKQKSKHIIHVLLSDLITPHTFFKYIFLNKQKFDNHEIPQAVFWHEETHAMQKHSIDVLFVELLQVIFWFNPLIYFAKRSIKMNHEFLADQAVLNKGIMASNYQHILLAFSSNATEPQLANAINYSSIRLKVFGKQITLFNAFGQVKKRFTVMKTQTSKRNMWLKSILLLPLLALTLYGFSETEIVEQEIDTKAIFSESIDLFLNEKGELLLGEDVINLEQIEEMFKRNNDLYVSITAFANIDAEIVKKAVKNIREIGVKKMTYCTSGDTAQPSLDEVRKEMMESLIKSQKQQKATPAEVEEYNKLSKHYNSQTPGKTIIKQKDMRRLRELHDKMTSEQKTNAEPMPNFPPPPPPTTIDGLKNATLVNQTISPPPPPPPANASEKQTKAYEKAIEAYKIQRESYTYKHTNAKGEVLDIIVIPENDGTIPPPPPPISPPAPKDKTQTQIKTGFVDTNGEKLYYVENSNGKTYYNRGGNKVDKNGKKLNGNVQVNASDVIPGQFITKIYSDDEIVVEFKNNQNKRDGTLEIPAPPPPPVSPLDHVIEMAKKNAVFFYEGKSISSDEAVRVLKVNGELNINTKQLHSKQPQVYITKEPINTDN